MLKTLFNRACNFINNDTLTQVFSCEYFEIFKNTYFEEHLRTTALVLCYCFANKIVRAKDTVDFKLYHESVDTTHLLDV